jgi:di/tricarboxylate transporter
LNPKPRKEKDMKGAIVFLVAFFAALAATIAYADLPPGKQIYSALGLPTTDYLVLGIPATTLIVAVFNAVIYGIIAWIAFTVTERIRKPKI